MEDLDRKIVGLLASDGRMSFTDLGKATGLSTSAVHQRVKRLEQRGIIQGYAATVDHTALDLPLTALISIRPIDPSQPDDSPERLREVPEIESCYSVAGDSSYVLIVRVASPARSGEPAGRDPGARERLHDHDDRAEYAVRTPSTGPVKVLLSDLFSTLISGGDDERDVVNARMGAALGVDAVAFQRAFDASSYERFIGAYGDLPNTLRVIAERCGGTPTDEQVQEATGLRRALAQRLLGRAPVATLETLAAFKAAGWRIGLVSNITAETQVQWPTSPLAQYFDATAFSAEVGAAKPEPAIYEIACAALGRRPRRLHLRWRRQRQRAPGRRLPRHARDPYDGTRGQRPNLVRTDNHDVRRAHDLPRSVAARVDDLGLERRDLDLALALRRDQQDGVVDRLRGEAVVVDD